MGKVESAIREEVKRLAKKAARETQAKTVADVRRLKTKVSALQKEISALKKERASEQAKRRLASASQAIAGDSGQKVRLSPGLIKKLRNKLNITQPQLAALVGVSSAAVAAWEVGKANPRPAAKVKIAALRSAGRRDVRRLLAEKPVPRKAAKKKTRRRKTKRGKK